MQISTLIVKPTNYPNILKNSIIRLQGFAKCTEKNLPYNLLLMICQKKTLAQVFPYEFCEFFSNSYFVQHLKNAAFIFSNLSLYQILPCGSNHKIRI